MPPSGNTTAEVKAYYDYLFSQYIQQIPANRTQILWSGPLAIAFWAAVLILFFFLYSYYLNRAHRKRGELYGAVSFAGSILERIGPLSAFSWAVWLGVVLAALYFIVTHILYGLVY
ncbi:MAG: hypothetical protein KDE28_26510 [Anaerolineales bacterium]|nr:hypothetical protein [Anaerolineales bacterium]